MISQVSQYTFSQVDEGIWEGLEKTQPRDEFLNVVFFQFIAYLVKYCICLISRIYIVHDEVKDKSFELELSWVGESNIFSLILWIPLQNNINFKYSCWKHSLSICILSTRGVGSDCVLYLSLRLCYNSKFISEPVIWASFVTTPNRQTCGMFKSMEIVDLQPIVSQVYQHHSHGTGLFTCLMEYDSGHSSVHKSMMVELQLLLHCIFIELRN